VNENKVLGIIVVP